MFSFELNGVFLKTKVFDKTIFKFSSNLWSIVPLYSGEYVFYSQIGDSGGGNPLWIPSHDQSLHNGLIVSWKHCLNLRSHK